MENVLIILLALAACGSLGVVGTALLRESSSAASLNTLRKAVYAPEAEIVVITCARSDSSAAAAAMPPQPESVERVQNERLAALCAENAEFYGWMTIPGTQTDDPVMFTPSDEQYYLRRDFYKKRSKSGTLFLAGGSEPDAYPANLIIYGHNMKNGSRFGELDSYLDEAFLRAHNTLRFDTPSRGGSYRIVSVYLTELDKDAPFKFYHYARICSAEQFDAYAQETLSRSRCNAGEPLAYGDELLTLVTCSHHAEEGRLIVVAKRVGD